MARSTRGTARLLAVLGALAQLLPACGGGGQAPAPTCVDGVRNGPETGLDCGGGCGPCATGAGCVRPTDCQTGVCTAATCRAATCGDGVRNGAETGVDCGAGCGPCPDGTSCTAPEDCRSGVCLITCAAPTCGDLVRNGAETDVDCGGPDCAACGAGARCGGDGDCVGVACALDLTASQRADACGETGTCAGSGDCLSGRVGTAGVCQ